MSLDATRWAWDQKVKATQKIILLSLADRADEKHCCFPSIERLEIDTGLNRKTIMLSIKKLAEIGLLQVSKSKSKQGKFLRNTYQLIGVNEREKPCTENGTRTEKPCPNFTENHVPKTDETMSQNRDTNLPVNLPIEPKEKINKKKFLPPTKEQVVEYATNRNRRDLADRFFDYFVAGDWHDANGKQVLNWKQKFITWESINEKSSRADKPKSKTDSFWDHTKARIAATA